jgi:hypothetical protein
MLNAQVEPDVREVKPEGCTDCVRVCRARADTIWFDCRAKTYWGLVKKHWKLRQSVTITITYVCSETSEEAEWLGALRSDERVTGDEADDFRERAPGGTKVEVHKMRTIIMRWKEGCGPEIVEPADAEEGSEPSESQEEEGGKEQ